MARLVHTPGGNLLYLPGGRFVTDQDASCCGCGGGGGACDYGGRGICFDQPGQSPFICCGSRYRFTMSGRVSYQIFQPNPSLAFMDGSITMDIRAGADCPALITIVDFQVTRGVSGTTIPPFTPTCSTYRGLALFGGLCSLDPLTAFDYFINIFNADTAVLPFVFAGPPRNSFSSLCCPRDDSAPCLGPGDGVCSGACSGPPTDGYTVAWSGHANGYGGFFTGVQDFRAASQTDPAVNSYRASIDWRMTPIDPCVIFDCDQPDGSVLGGHGACCMPDGSCTIRSEEECRRRGGQYNEGVRCSDANCPQPPPPPTGICCGPSGCLGRMTQLECVMQSGQWHPDPADCSLCQLPPPIRPCCFPDGSCTMLTGADCNAAGGTWQMNGTTCEAAGCRPQGGACCYAALNSHGQLVWVCIDGPTVSQASCDALAVNAPSNFYPGLTCDQISCPIQPGRRGRIVVPTPAQVAAFGGGCSTCGDGSGGGLRV